MPLSPEQINIFLSSNNNTILFDTGNNFIIFSLLEKKVIKSFNHDYLYFNIVKLIFDKKIEI